MEPTGAKWKMTSIDCVSWQNPFSTHCPKATKGSRWECGSLWTRQKWNRCLVYSNGWHVKILLAVLFPGTMYICRNLDVVTSHFLPFHWGGRVKLPLLWSADFFFSGDEIFCKVPCQPPAPIPPSLFSKSSSWDSGELGSWKLEMNKEWKEKRFWGLWASAEKSENPARHGWPGPHLLKDEGCLHTRTKEVWACLGPACELPSKPWRIWMSHWARFEALLHYVVDVGLRREAAPGVWASTSGEGLAFSRLRTHSLTFHPSCTPVSG